MNDPLRPAQPPSSPRRPGLRSQLESLCREWRHTGLPSREALVTIAGTLEQWKRRHGSAGLWQIEKRLFTATLDDSLGQGLEIIQAFAETAGLTVTPLGLRQNPQVIIDACRRHRPDYLGLTILWAETETDLASVARHLPPETRLIAGGPAFRYDSELANRCGVSVVASSILDFLVFLLAESLPPPMH